MLRLPMPVYALLTIWLQLWLPAAAAAAAAAAAGIWALSYHSAQPARGLLLMRLRALLRM
jgi:hypothetical protein